MLRHVPGTCSTWHMHGPATSSSTHVAMYALVFDMVSQRLARFTAALMVRCAAFVWHSYAVCYPKCLPAKTTGSELSDMTCLRVNCKEDSVTCGKTATLRLTRGFFLGAYVYFSPVLHTTE